MIILHSGKRVARKQHICDGIDGIYDQSILEERGVSDYVCNDIAKGDTYHSHTTAEYGEIFTWKCCIECHRMIVKHDLWDYTGRS